ncbi:MAG: lytic transglycosylase domain-containing protein [Clostridia bacterium]|nr:lytic transglycosylase domain-containing protein [Clostridia bacterium]
MKKIIKIVFALAAVALLVGIGVREIYARFPLKYGGYIEKYAEEYGLDKFMVSGVIYAESRFDNTAHSGLARGLMQLTDATADWVAEKLGIDYDYDMAEEPEINIKMGCYYLSCLIEKYHNEETALAAYNAGMGNVSKWLADARYSSDGEALFDMPYGETKKYVKRVKIFTYIYKRLYAKRR